ncbi:MAG: HD domain-containing phosphohydrolase, partial [Thermoanaerobaculia bacterium]
MAPSERVSVLCVDDEPNVLDGLSRQLRGAFAVTTAVGGAAGLGALKSRGPFAVVVSDLRMPGMDGVAFLKCVREAAPETVRVLLTGQADFASAVAAVNEGNIFRFLLKPCPGELLTKSLNDAAEQYRLITAERVLLRDTLVGSMKMLIELLALASPTAFGRAIRARQYVAECSAGLGSCDSWHLDVAAMLSQVGCMTLPPTTLEKLHAGEPLAAAEEAQVERLPEVAEQILANIPRLEPVREILRYLRKNYDGGGVPAGAARGEAIPWGARVLRVVLDFDKLRTHVLPEAQVFGKLRERAGDYDPAILEAFI